MLVYLVGYLVMEGAANELFKNAGDRACKTAR